MKPNRRKWLSLVSAMGQRCQSWYFGYSTKNRNGFCLSPREYLALATDSGFEATTGIPCCSRREDTAHFRKDLGLLQQFFMAKDEHGVAQACRMPRVHNAACCSRHVGPASEAGAPHAPSELVMAPLLLPSAGRFSRPLRPGIDRMGRAGQPGSRTGCSFGAWSCAVPARTRTACGFRTHHVARTRT